MNGVRALIADLLFGLAEWVDWKPYQPSTIWVRPNWNPRLLLTKEEARAGRAPLTEGEIDALKLIADLDDCGVSW